MVGSFTGEGAAAKDLFSPQQTELTFTSNAGIVRLLKTSVTESIPQNVSKVKDTLGSLGSALGNLLKVKRDPIDLSPSIVSQNAEAALNVTYGTAEFAYTNLQVTAVRGVDRNVRLSTIAMTATNARLSGTGEITYVKDLALAAQPLSLDLQPGVRKGLAAVMAPAGLLATGQDGDGFTPLKQSLHFGGTLEAVDSSQWHDLLVKVANRKPAGTK